MSSKAVLYALLRDALQSVRTLSVGSGPLAEAQRREIWALTYATHNWPEGLRDAATEDDFDRFLAHCWRQCPPPARDWMSHGLVRLGVDPDRLADPTVDA